MCLTKMSKHNLCICTVYIALWGFFDPHCSGTYRLVYLTPEYITHAIDLIQDIDKKVGESCFGGRELYHHVKITEKNKL